MWKQHKGAIPKAISLLYDWDIMIHEETGTKDRKLKVLDLFSGIGGFSLGLERTGGFETVAFCEIEPFPQKVLRKHWPDVPIYEDVKELDGEQFKGSVDVITGGFPCQDLSVAGAQSGINGERSGLWSEMVRLVSEIRPRYVIVENVPNLLAGDRGSWFGKVLGDLAEIGYDAEWNCIPASYVGSPQLRDRVWLVAYPDEGKKRTRRFEWVSSSKRENRPRLVLPRRSRNSDGIPDWMDRVGACGNSVVPQIPEMIGYALLSHAAPTEIPIPTAKVE